MNPLDDSMINNGCLAVLKLGTTSVVDGKNRVRTQLLTELLAEVVKFGTRGGRVVLVSSGAIALGAARLRTSRPSSTDLAGQRACSMAGQPALMSAYQALAGAQGLLPVFSLLTSRDFRGDAVGEVREGLTAALAVDRVLPVISHNDATCLGARFGDNDHLAVDVATTLDATAVIFGSDSARYRQDLHRFPADRTGGTASMFHAAFRAQERNVAAVVANSVHMADVLRGRAECISFPTPESRRAGLFGGR